MTTYYAASVPRSVRTARLAHLRGDAIIGMWFVPSGAGNQVFDVIMLPEAEFLRVKNQLATPAMGATLQQGQGAAPYVPKDVKNFTVPENDPTPAATAAAYFRKEFKVVG